MIKYADRVLQTTQTTGTGTYSLDGTVPAGFQSAVAGIGGGSKGTFHIDNGVDWETIVGTVTDAATDTISRDRVLASSNGGAAVNWGSGTKNVRLILASKQVFGFDETGSLILAPVSAGGSANAQTLTFDPVPTAYSNGELLAWFSQGNITGTTTINKNALGTKTVKWKGSDLLNGSFLTGDLMVGIYRSSTGFVELITPPRTAFPSIPALFQDKVLYGLVLSNNGTDAVNDIDIAAGSAVSDDGTTIMTYAGGTKRLDAAWAVGNGNGGLDTGAIANTTYHLWLIHRPDTGVTDVLFSASASSPTMPTNYTKKKCIGSIVRAGATILAFRQYKDEFLLSVPVLDHTTGSGAGLGTITVGLPSVPSGVRLKALVNYVVVDNANYLYLFPPETTAANPATSSAPLATGGSAAANTTGQAEVWTNTSAQISARQSSNSTGGFRVATLGWKDPRI